MARKLYKRLCNTSMFLFLGFFVGLNGRRETFNSIPIILILFTNKNVANEGRERLYTGYKNPICEKKKKKEATNINCSSFAKIISFDAVFITSLLY